MARASWDSLGVDGRETDRVWTFRMVQMGTSWSWTIGWLDCVIKAWLRALAGVPCEIAVDTRVLAGTLTS